MISLTSSIKYYKEFGRPCGLIFKKLLLHSQWFFCSSVLLMTELHIVLFGLTCTPCDRTNRTRSRYSGRSILSIIRIIIWCKCFFLVIGRERKWNHACSLLVYVISVITPGRQRALTAFRRTIIDLLATDKSQYFAQPRPIIVNYYRPNWTPLIALSPPGQYLSKIFCLRHQMN